MLFTCRKMNFSFLFFFERWERWTVWTVKTKNDDDILKIKIKKEILFNCGQEDIYQTMHRLSMMRLAWQSPFVRSTVLEGYLSIYTSMIPPITSPNVNKGEPPIWRGYRRGKKEEIVKCYCFPLSTIQTADDWVDHGWCQSERPLICRVMGIRIKSK